MSLEKNLFTTAEVAEYLTVSKCQVFRLVKLGRLKQTYLSPKRVVFKKSAIEDFLASCDKVAA
jgi:excisionase family DNA binding protein